MHIKNTSHLDIKIESAVNISKKVSKIWCFGNFETKKGIQNLIFPKGLSIASVIRQHRTDKVNQVFYLNSSISSDNSCKRKNPSTKIVNGSCLVAGT